MRSSPRLPGVIGRALVALALGACLALAGGSGLALAQEDDVQTLPDPNGAPAPGDDGAGAGGGSADDGGSQGEGAAQDEGTAQGGGGQADDALPETGLSALLLATFGLTLLAAGIAVRPLARRRRRYTTDTWVGIVRAGSPPAS